MRRRYYLDFLPIYQAQRLLFRRLYRYMALDDAAARPSSDTRAFLDSLRDDILAGRVLTYDERVWPERDRSDRSLTRSPRSCGPGLLTFIEYLGDTLQRFGPTRVPLHLALKALARSEFDPGSTWLECGSNGNDVLEMTRYGQGALGLHGEVDLGECLPDDPDAGQLFEAYFQSVAAAA